MFLLQKQYISLYQLTQREEQGHWSCFLEKLQQPHHQWTPSMSPPNVIFAKAVCHMLWSMCVRLESKHSQPCKNRAQIGLFWACVYMNLPLVTELACCLFRCFFGGRSVAIYGDTSEYYSVIVIIQIDRNIHCLLWTARGVAFVCRPELPLRPWKQQPLKSKTAKFLCALAGT